MIKLLLILILIISGCGNKKDPPIDIEETPTPIIENIETEEIDETIIIDFLGYSSNYQNKLDQYLFKMNYTAVDELDMGGDEVYLIDPVKNIDMEINWINYDENNEESYAFFALIQQDEPFILICNESDIRPNNKIIVNNTQEFSLQISLENGELIQPDKTETVDWGFKERELKDSLVIFDEIISATFDILFHKYSLQMPEAVELITLVSMYFDPAYVNGEIEIVDGVTYKIPIDVIEGWTIVLFDDYTGELPNEFDSNIYEVNYKTINRINDYELLEIKEMGEFIDLLYKRIDIETGYEELFVVSLIKSNTSSLNYRIFDVIISVG